MGTASAAGPDDHAARSFSSPGSVGRWYSSRVRLSSVAISFHPSAVSTDRLYVYSR